jgi:hypothetical protein
VSRRRSGVERTTRARPRGVIIERREDASAEDVRHAEEFFRETKVNERRDDTTKPAGESRPARSPGDYYYDDSTGYEIYNPEDEGSGAEGEAPNDEA